MNNDKSQIIRIEIEDNEEEEVQGGLTLESIYKNLYKVNTKQAKVVAAKINGELRELSESLNKDATVEFVDLKSQPGFRIYRRSLLFLLSAAFYELYPDAKVIVNNSISKGFYIEVGNLKDTLDNAIVRVEQKMRDYVERDISIQREYLHLEDAREYFEYVCALDKFRLINYTPQNRICIYILGDFKSYSFDLMVPGTGYLANFELKPYGTGLLLRVPLWHKEGLIPPFDEERRTFDWTQEERKNLDILKVMTVPDVNKIIEREEGAGFIRLCEALQERKIFTVADRIIKDMDHSSRIILVSGPSASGKTTFTKRLALALRSYGLEPVNLGVDQYFKERVETPLDEEGQLDFECIENVDIVLLNRHIDELLSGKSIKVPHFSFHAGRRTWSDQIKTIEKNQPIIIEGTHALNPVLLPGRGRDVKFKIFVSPLNQINLDDHNRIHSSDIRKIRRIVRDDKFRNYFALETLQRWRSIRKGEEIYVLPFREQADVLFNSLLHYELNVLKYHVTPLLQQVTPHSDKYCEARRLLKMLSYLLPLPDYEVPRISILREFIGNSGFLY